MVARFPECIVVSNWLPHTPIQIFFCLVLVYKTVWCSLSSSSIQTGVLAVTFYITLLYFLKSHMLVPILLQEWHIGLWLCMSGERV